MEVSVSYFIFFILLRTFTYTYFENEEKLYETLTSVDPNRATRLTNRAQEWSMNTLVIQFEGF